MICLPLLVALAPALTAPWDYERAMAELDALEFGAALVALEGEADAVQQARGRVEVFFRGRLWGRVLTEAEAGLAHDPANAWLLWRAAGAALWLADGPAAARYAARLAGAVEAGGVPDDQHTWWSEQAREFATLAESLDAAEELRVAALGRARGTVLGALSAVVLGAVLLSAGSRVRRPRARTESR